MATQLSYILIAPVEAFVTKEISNVKVIHLSSHWVVRSFLFTRSPLKLAIEINLTHFVRHRPSALTHSPQ